MSIVDEGGLGQKVSQTEVKKKIQQIFVCKLIYPCLCISNIA